MVQKFAAETCLSALVGRLAALEAVAKAALEAVHRGLGQAAAMVNEKFVVSGRAQWPVCDASHPANAGLANLLHYGRHRRYASNAYRPQINL